MSFKLLTTNDILPSNEAVTSTMWSNEISVLTSMYTSSAQIDLVGQFYYNIYQADPLITPSAEVQFSIAYCDIEGSGSQFFTTGSPHTPTNVNYNQYKSLILGGTAENFVFGTTTSSYFYALPMERTRYKEKILPGSLELVVGGKSLTDTSPNNPVAIHPNIGRRYNIVSGSVGSPIGTDVYGWLLPDIGLILLDGSMLDNNTTMTNTGQSSNTDNKNPEKLLNAITAFRLNSEESISSDYIFVRARNDEFNYSNNPSFADNVGDFIYPAFVNNPKTYITSVGLYNNLGDLLAVAKLSRPLLKDFTKELLLRIKLDF